jgi:hypothetical protein
LEQQEQQRQQLVPFQQQEQQRPQLVPFQQQEQQRQQLEQLQQLELPQQQELPQELEQLLQVCYMQLKQVLIMRLIELNVSFLYPLRYELKLNQ